MRYGLIGCVALLLHLLSFSVHACVPDDQTLCLENGRFMVTLDWADVAANPKTLSDTAQTGIGTGRYISDDTGLFWLFGDQNYEIMVKVLDACPVNNHFWVFAAATTNVAFTMTVTDTETDQVRSYLNPALVDAAPITDTVAFATCDTPTTTTPQLPTPPAAIDFNAAEAGTCVADAITLCLFSNRFAVQVDWASPQGNSGAGMANPVTNLHGNFWFFSANTMELLINVYDGRAVNGNFWFFLSGVTTVGYQMRVTDTLTGEIRVYENAPGNVSTILDIGPQASVPLAIPTLTVFSQLLLVLGLVGLAMLMLARQIGGLHR